MTTLRAGFGGATDAEPEESVDVQRRLAARLKFAQDPLWVTAYDEKRVRQLQRRLQKETVSQQPPPSSLEAQTEEDPSSSLDDEPMVRR